MIKPEEGVVGTPEFMVDWSGVPVATWDLGLASEVGKSCWLSPSPSGCALSLGGHSRSCIEPSDTQLVSRELVGGGINPTDLASELLWVNTVYSSKEKCEAFRKTAHIS